MSENDKGLYGTLEVWNADLVEDAAVNIDDKLEESLELLERVNHSFEGREVDDPQIRTDLSNLSQTLDETVRYFVSRDVEVTDEHLQKLREKYKEKYELEQQGVQPKTDLKPLDEKRTEYITRLIDKYANIPIKDILTKEQRQTAEDIHRLQRLTIKKEPSATANVFELLDAMFPSEEEILELRAKQKDYQLQHVMPIDREMQLTIAPTIQQILDLVKREKEMLLDMFDVDDYVRDKFTKLPVSFKSGLKPVVTKKKKEPESLGWYMPGPGAKININRAYSGIGMPDTIRHELIHGLQEMIVRRDLDKLRRNIKSVDKLMKELKKFKDSGYDVPSYMSDFSRTAQVLMQKSLREQSEGHGKAWSNLMVLGFGKFMSEGEPLSSKYKDLALEIGPGNEPESAGLFIVRAHEEAKVSIRSLLEKFKRENLPIDAAQVAVINYMEKFGELPSDYERFFGTPPTDISEPSPVHAAVPDEPVYMPAEPPQEAETATMGEPIVMDIPPDPIPLLQLPEEDPSAMPAIPMMRPARRVPARGTPGRPRETDLRFGRPTILRDPIKMRQLTFIDLGDIDQLIEDRIFGRYCT